jgi:hypothetical protein
MQYSADFWKNLLSGQGPTYQTLEGTGKVNNAARDWANKSTYADWVRGTVGMGDSARGTFMGLDTKNPAPIQGTTAGGEGDGSAYNLADPNYGWGRPQDREYLQTDNSRFDEGIVGRHYYDNAGKHDRSVILNDPANIRDESWGDFIKSPEMMAFLAIAGGMSALPGGPFGGPTGTVGSGSGFVGEGATSGIGAWDGAAGSGVIGEGAVGGGAGGFIGEGATSGIPGWDGLAGSGVGGGGLPGGGLTGMEGGIPPNPYTGGGGGLLGGKAFTLPGIGDVSWMDLLKVGGVLGGGLAGAQGNEQNQTVTKELPDYLKGPVTGQNGLLSSADRLMQHQLYGTPFAPR